MAIDVSKLQEWTYHGLPFNAQLIELDKKSPNFIQGFVYIITHVPSGKAYIGKKNFVKPHSKKVNGKKKKSLIESDWKTYCGSSEYLLIDIEKFGIENFSREILHLCAMKGIMSYHETNEIFCRGALTLPDKFWNEWVSCRIRRSHLKSIIVAPPVK